MALSGANRDGLDLEQARTLTQPDRRIGQRRIGVPKGRRWGRNFALCSRACGASSPKLTCGQFAIIPASLFSLQKCQTSWRRKQSSANRSPPVGFPVPRENTGKFADFGLEIAKAPRLSEGNSIACQRNSLVTKTGKICWRSGKLKRVTANLIPITGTRCLAPHDLRPRFKSWA